MIRTYRSLNVYKKAVLQLTLAGIIWGLSFICVLTALEDFSTSTLIFWRFIFAFIFGEIIFFFFYSKDIKKSKSDIHLSILSGLALGLTLLLQTHGLHWTTATKSSFITSLYVVIIPFAGFLFFKKPIKFYHILFALIAFVGIGFLLGIHQRSDFQFNFGDLLTLGCAVSSTFHILFVSAAAPKVINGFRFNTYQTLWSLLLVLPFLIYEMHYQRIPIWPETIHLKSILSLLFLSFFVTLGAFTLQIIAQKSLTSTTASLLCLLEAPFAFMFAFLILGEKLLGLQILGIILILLSSCFSVYIDRPQNRQE